MKDVRISDDWNWQKIHWQTLCTFYRRSPYFEYYEDDFAPFYEKKCEFLFQYNMELLEMINGLLGLDKELVLTEKYESTYDTLEDLRNVIHPKIDIAESGFTPPKYIQVFESKTQFFPNLSIVDLLFNEGPNAVNLLKA